MTIYNCSHDFDKLETKELRMKSSREDKWGTHMRRSQIGSWSAHLLSDQPDESTFLDERLNTLIHVGLSNLGKKEKKMGSDRGGWKGNCPKILWLGKIAWEVNLAVTKTLLFAIATSRAHQAFPPTHTSLLLFVREIIHPQIWRRTLWFVFKRINLQFHGTGDCYVVVRKNELKARN